MIEKKDLFEARTNGYWTYRIPGIAVTKNDAVLVTAEARPGQGGDYDFNDVLMRRSTDGGRTFGPVVKIVDHTSYGDGPASNFVMIPDRDSGRVVAVFHHDYARAFTIYSDDDGATWSEPVEITDVFEQFKSDYAWRVCSNGCGHGLQLRSGRMVVPVWLSDGSGSEHGKHRGHRPSIVTLITSDDCGRSWQRGGIVIRQGDTVGGETVHNASETTAVELEDGSLMFNARTESQPHRRLVAVSSDGGASWGGHRWDAALLDPICMASLMRYNWAGDGRPGCILFSNPDNLDKTMATWAYDRKRLSIKISNDDGSTWPITRVLEEGPSGYSALARSSDGTVLCLYECDNVTGMCDDRYLRLARFDLDWQGVGA